MSQITVGSLFSGIGGLELGLERAGMRVVWQVEKDDYCRRVLAKHWPDVERFEDVKDVGAHNLKPVDLICGGFPCQDISYAGKGAGLSGQRSGLWYEFARIIREMEPRIVVVENVAALLTRGLDAVLGTLASLGYDAEWDRVSAADVGAPHLRNRTFVVAYASRPGSGANTRSASSDEGAYEGRATQDDNLPHRNGEGRRAWNGSDAHISGLEGRQKALRPQEGRDADAGHARAPVSGVGRDDQWLVEPDVGRVANGVPRRVDRLRALGNAVVPQVAKYIGRLIVEADEAMRVA